MRVRDMTVRNAVGDLIGIVGISTRMPAPNLQLQTAGCT